MMPISHAVSALAVVFLLIALGFYVYVRSKPSVQAARRWELERRRRALHEDFGDGAVWQMGRHTTQAMRSTMPPRPTITRRGFLLRMAVSLLILIAGRNAKAEASVPASRSKQPEHTDHVDNHSDYHSDHSDTTLTTAITEAKSVKLTPDTHDDECRLCIGLVA